MEYGDFLKRKTFLHQSSGLDVSTSDLNNMLFDWQKNIVRWALFKGRAALFEGCGLGKTIQQLEWAKKVNELTGGNVLIFAPLAVSHQTKREGEKFGINVNVCKAQRDVVEGINITNYEKIDNFDPSLFIGVVLDESGILKNFSSVYKNKIIEAYLNTPYKLACTATPAPNDYTELGNTAEFLGVMTRSEMLSMFFINDSGDTGKWRLKGHVKSNVFWKWLASWSIMISKPSDLGFSDEGFILPELIYHENIITYSGKYKTLFIEHATTLAERRQARIESLQERVDMAARIANQTDRKWIAWCNLNVESEALSKQINGSIEVKGSDDPEYKEKSLLGFANNGIRALVSKPRIAGFGLNLQACSDMAFVGLSDSYEQLYQAIRRCWRFGQKNTVNAHIIIGEREGSVLENIKRKEKDMEDMIANMVFYMRSFMEDELSSFKKSHTLYNPRTEMRLPSFLMEVA